ncbi:UDP-N-acetylglucosamine 2-epimerase [Paenibacillus wynnii]|uniref:UDP-N-acetylglucosamine 2-epimerase n=1 Tax=Paenibacillus wynnii TaxID=268407 RepID=UPI00278FB2F5|nr:UDP-N-acetylglucosamine 2-epimerase [Paenibacillus wynnii]MDQ0194831.1 UDP-N-acetylglucosamine 2-epimerase (non-hydrolyzing)/GDP/UDP-N,N'-diacetylbacillosamine 2-epimerase (hydrolyzing) [Paenibacillus wynnii]
MSERKLCVVTGTRAEYGLLYGLLKEIEQDPTFQLQLIATCMHLSPEFGMTAQVIESDGFSIQAKVEMLLSSDTPVGVAKSIGLGVIGFADAFDHLRPDLVILFGDRYEILAAAQAALVAKIPIAHIGGGDSTEGAFDESIRHSLTKMSHIHFVSHAGSAARVRQMGENPNFIFTVGSPGIDQIKSLKLLTPDELQQSLDFEWRARNILVTFHPVTMEEFSSTLQFNELLQALDRLGPELGILFTKPNSDPEGRRLAQMTDDYVNTHPNAKAYTSLGQLRYLSAISIVDAVVGNSSSGLYEAPSFHKPSVNIGDRQKGRISATSVIQCAAQADDITKAILRAFELDCSETTNPYGSGDSCKKIVAQLKQISNYRTLLKKHFFEVDTK